jgi:hypothetical protein
VFFQFQLIDYFNIVIINLIIKIKDKYYIILYFVVGKKKNKNAGECTCITIRRVNAIAPYKKNFATLKVLRVKALP